MPTAIPLINRPTISIIKFRETTCGTKAIMRMIPAVVIDLFLENWSAIDLQHGV
jgi:hypothetical protein